MRRTQHGYQPDLAYIHHTAYSGFVADAAPGLLRMLDRNGIRKGLVVDLGCGAGEWAHALTRRGYSAFGLDISPAMIALARKTAPQARFAVGSFRNTKLPHCAAVTALGEVLNYTFDGDRGRAELARFFARVHEALEPGGLLIFDVAEPGRVDPRQPARNWFEGKDWALLLELKENARQHTLTRRMTIFRKLGSAYRRSEEIHRLRLYPRADILRDLRAAGFTARTISRYGKTKFWRGLVGCVARKR
ncbi:MAG: class I SAM-dependent methyltransferase [Terriglobales bacterium]